MKQFATLMLNPELFDIDAKAYTKAGLAQVGTKFKALLTSGSTTSRPTSSRACCPPAG